MIDILNPLISTEIQSSYIPYVMGPDTPSVDDQDKAWIELDSQKRPLSIRTFYNGNWRRVYNGMVGEIRMYSGNPGDTTTWDADGHGVVGGTYDGWQICNGKNNSPDLTDKFIVGAHMNNQNGQTGYDSGWQSFVDGKTCTKTGGSKDHMITGIELPPINPDDPLGSRSSLVIRGHPNGDTDHSDVAVIVDSHYSGGVTNQVTIAHYGADPSGNNPQVAMPTVPPWIAYGLIIFQGYTT